MFNNGIKQYAVFLVIFCLLFCSGLAPIWGENLFASARSSYLQTPEFRDELHEFITERLQMAHIPGMSAAIVKDGEILWTGAYGWSLINGSEATNDTLFQLASVSKTMIAIAVMQLWEDGLIDLDADINQYLPFNVVNPLASNIPITPRMLLTHTSSIRDSWQIMDSLYVWGIDSPVSLEQFMEDYLTRRGNFYNPDTNFYNDKPGTTYHYSNIGSTLAAYLVELITEIPFDRYCDLFIFSPLGMSETSWRLANVDLTRLAMPYKYQRGFFQDYPVTLFKYPEYSGNSPDFAIFHNGYTPYGFYTYPDYPDGLLKTTAPQLARFLAMFMQQGELNGIKILQKETVEEICRIQNPDIDPCQGLIWHYKKLSDWALLGHSGGDLGVATKMFFRPDDGIGVILLMNGDWSFFNESIIEEIEVRLFKEAELI